MGRKPDLMQERGSWRRTEPGRFGVGHLILPLTPGRAGGWGWGKKREEILREWRKFDIVTAEGRRAEMTREMARWQGSVATLLMAETCKVPFGPPM